MSRRDLGRLALACVSAVLAAGAAAPAAAQTTFTDRAAWAAAAGSHVTIDFEGIAPPGNFARFNDGLTLSGVTFRGAGSPNNSFPPIPLAVFDSGFDPYISDWNSGDMAQAPLSFGTVGAPPAGSITLPPGVTAFGFNYAVSCSITVTPSCGSFPWTVRLSTGAVILIPGSNPPPAMAFWGIVSPVPISSFQLEASASLTLLDNFSFQPSAVPTFSVWAMLALAALLAVAGMRSVRRRGGRRAQRAAKATPPFRPAANIAA